MARRHDGARTVAPQSIPQNLTENDASIHVVTATPEPSAIVLLLSAFGGLLFAGMMPSKLKFTGASR